MNFSLISTNIMSSDHGVCPLHFIPMCVTKKVTSLTLGFHGPVEVATSYDSRRLFHIPTLSYSLLLPASSQTPGQFTSQRSMAFHYMSYPDGWICENWRMQPKSRISIISEVYTARIPVWSLPLRIGSLWFFLCSLGSWSLCWGDNRLELKWVIIV